LSSIGDLPANQVHQAILRASEVRSAPRQACEVHISGDKAIIQPQNRTIPKLSQIFVYPIKSCAGISLDSAQVTARGLALDRRWMLVDEHGRFVTARKFPELVLVSVHIESTGLRVEASNRSPLFVPFCPEGEQISTSIWSDHVLGREVSMASRQWFSELLNTAVRLVYMDEECRRSVDPEFGRPGDQVSFADGYPFLLLSQASIEDLSEKLGRPVDVLRFRPNLVVEQTEAFAEDEWKEFDLGTIRFHVVKPCARCVIPSIDPITGRKDSRVTSVLASDRKHDGQVFFGQNLVHDGEGEIRVGNALHLRG